jgi:hypothetical protein
MAGGLDQGAWQPAAMKAAAQEISHRMVVGCINGTAKKRKRAAIVEEHDGAGNVSETHAG